MTDLPRIHPREFIVQSAHLALTGAVLSLRKEHDITDVEYLQWLANEQQSTLKYMLREERHGDNQTPAGWAGEEPEPREDKAWWLSWYHHDGAFAAKTPWWVSGTRPGGDLVIVAAVWAPSKKAAWKYIRSCYATPTNALEKRFIEPLTRSPFSERFPRADWMVWQDDPDQEGESDD